MFAEILFKEFSEKKSSQIISILWLYQTQSLFCSIFCKQVTVDSILKAGFNKFVFQWIQKLRGLC